METRAASPTGSGSAKAAGGKGGLAGPDTYTILPKLAKIGVREETPGNPPIRATSAGKHVGRGTERDAHAWGPAPAALSARGGTLGGHVSEARAPRDGGGCRTVLKGGGSDEATRKMAGDTEGSQEPPLPLPHAPGALTLLILIELPLELVEVRHAEMAA